MLKKYFSPTALALSIIVLLYTFYRSKIYYDGTLTNIMTFIIKSHTF